MRTRGVQLSIFNSVSRDALAPDGDIDARIEFDRSIGAFGFLDVKADLEQLLGRPVDLVTLASIEPRMRDRILRETVHAV